MYWNEKSFFHCFGTTDNAKEQFKISDIGIINEEIVVQKNKGIFLVFF